MFYLSNTSFFQPVDTVYFCLYASTFEISGLVMFSVLSTVKKKQNNNKVFFYMRKRFCGNRFGTVLLILNNNPRCQPVFN